MQETTILKSEAINYIIIMVVSSMNCWRQILIWRPFLPLLLVIYYHITFRVIKILIKSERNYSLHLHHKTIFTSHYNIVFCQISTFIKQFCFIFRIIFKGRSLKTRRFLYILYKFTECAGDNDRKENQAKNDWQRWWHQCGYTRTE